jgi:5-methylthioribose kinase
LDIENHAALLDYLRATDRIARDETPRFETLTGGVSNRTVLVERPAGESWVIKQALSKLRVKADWFSDPARVHREALGIRWLSQLAPPGTITPLVFEDFENHLIAMQAVPKPHENWKTMLLAGRIDLAHGEQFGHLLATIHVASARRSAELQPLFSDLRFFESLRLEPYYLFTAERVPEARDFLLRLVDDTRCICRSLVHGDFSPKNVLVHNEQLILLDHEVIHWGDPSFDIGFAMAHLLSKARISRYRHRFAMAPSLEFWRGYVELAGRNWADDVSSMAVCHTLGCLLARVDGRSPLEYLDATQRAAQRTVTLELMRDPPSMAAVIGEFVHLHRDDHPE